MAIYPLVVIPVARSLTSSQTSQQRYTTIQVHFTTDTKTPMKAKVTEQGLLIPKEFLEGVREVEIRASARRTSDFANCEYDDPILGLGQNPVTLGVPDASEHHDKYQALSV